MRRLLLIVESSGAGRGFKQRNARLLPTGWVRRRLNPNGGYALREALRGATRFARVERAAEPTMSARPLLPPGAGPEPAAVELRRGIMERVWSYPRPPAV